MAWYLGLSRFCGRTGLGCEWPRRLADNSTHPLTGVPWGNPRLTFYPHILQHGGESRDPVLGDGGGANIGGIGGTRGDYPGVGSVLLYR